MRSAPVLVLCLADEQAYRDRYAEPDKGLSRSEPWSIPYWDVDTGMAAMILLLAAEDAGLAACFFGVPADRTEAVFAVFGIPDRLRAVGVVSLGYPTPAGDRRSPSLRRGRRSLDDQVHWGSFGS